MRFARTLDGAARYHGEQLAAQQARGRTAQRVLTVDDFRVLSAVSARKHRPAQTAPYVASYRRSLTHLVLAVALPFAMVLASLFGANVLAAILLAGWYGNGAFLASHARYTRHDIEDAAGAVDAETGIGGTPVA